MIKTSVEEKRIVEMYMAELEEMPGYTNEKILDMAQRYVKGETNLRDELVVANLSLVTLIVEAYKDGSVSEGDLISEGNLALMEAVSSYKEGDFFQYLSRKITSAIEGLVRTEEVADEGSKEYAEKINTLDELTRELSEDGKEPPTAAELAKIMGLPEEEVVELLKESIKALNSDN